VVCEEDESESERDGNDTVRADWRGTMSGIGSMRVRAGNCVEMYISRTRRSRLRLLTVTLHTEMSSANRSKPFAMSVLVVCGTLLRTDRMISNAFLRLSSFLYFVMGAMVHSACCGCVMNMITIMVLIISNTAWCG